MINYFKVKNWDDFQHYKDRNPPWIKLHNHLLDDYDFECLGDAAKGHLLCIWMLASRTKNLMPFDVNWISKKIGSSSKVNLKLLLESGFLVMEHDASTMLQDGEQVATVSVPSEEKSRGEERQIREDLYSEAFEIFYSAGLVKKSKVKALSTFKSLVKQMECDPLEFAELLKSDVQYRINNNQFGINKLHPSTYLNQQRWTDEHEESNNEYAQGGRKLSAAERIRERNEAKYGQSSGGLGLATDGGDLRGAVGEGTRGNSFIDMESGSQQSDPGTS